MKMERGSRKGRKGKEKREEGNEEAGKGMQKR